MNDETERLDEKVSRGRQAKAILNNELVREALDAMKERQFSGISKSPYKDIDGREECYKMLRTIESFEAQFSKWVEEGKSAETLLERGLRQVKKILPMG